MRRGIASPSESEPVDEWRGKVAFITGGSQGIGRGCAEVLVEKGAAVAICAVPDSHLEEAVDAIRAAGGDAVAAPADVSDRDAVRGAVELVVDRFGRLDTLVASAGIQRYGTVADTPEETWDEVFAVNVKGVYLAAQVALPHLRGTRGSIVVVSSVQGHQNQPNVAAYAASKGALDALVRSMAIDEARHGVRVNAVCPGSVDTPMLRASAQRFSDGTEAGIEALVRDWGRTHPLGRVATPHEVGEVVAFLAGPRASFVTGEDVRVDGGLLATIGVALPD
jgi:NAD(P)-dependent dehydrogenase (short-subunit alcohol dehydrogenase family)